MNNEKDKKLPEPIRLQKYFSTNNVMSRRAAEQEIKLGHITVNGEIAQIGQSVYSGIDEVRHNGFLVEPAAASGHTYIMLNKPIGYITTMSDEHNRLCITDLLPHELITQRIYPIGRLDMYSDGLLILTNDGDLTNKLTHPSNETPKVYQLKAKGRIPRDKISDLSRSMIIDGYKIRPVNVEILDIRNDYTMLSLTLYEGRNRQIRKMCDQTEIKILRLTRVAIGDLQLGNLPSGKWKNLTDTQVRYLKEGQ